MQKQKTGGRSFGTPNKRTKELKEKLRLVIEKELETIDETLASLEPKFRLELIVKLMNYVIPKAIEVPTNEPYTVKVIRTIVDGKGIETIDENYKE